MRFRANLVGAGLVAAVIPFAAQAETENFQQSRTVQVITGQPDLMDRNDDRTLWADIQSGASTIAGADATFVMGAVGAQTQVGADTTLGAMLQIDRATHATDTAETEGFGFLLGPYVVHKFATKPYYFEGRLLIGTTRNELNAAGDPSVQFDTTRALAFAKVAGDWDFGGIAVTPSVAMTRLSETRELYFDATDTEIENQPSTVTEIAIGVDAARDVAFGDSAITFTGGVTAVWSTATGAAADNAFEDARAKIDLRADYTLDSGMTLFAQAGIDGLGQDSFESTSLRFGFMRQF